jgi:hypothetical protein
MHNNNAKHEIVRKSHLPFFNPISLRAFCKRLHAAEPTPSSLSKRKQSSPSQPLLAETGDGFVGVTSSAVSASPASVEEPDELRAPDEIHVAAQGAIQPLAVRGEETALDETRLSAQEQVALLLVIPERDEVRHEEWLQRGAQSSVSLLEQDEIRTVVLLLAVGDEETRLSAQALVAFLLAIPVCDEFRREAR